MFRPVPKFAAACGAALLLAAAATLGPSLWARYLGALSRRSAVLYQPRERVTGSDEPVAPRVPPATELLDPAALEIAARYAGEHGAQALIIVRHDHIVFERYWHGTGFDTMLDSGSFTPLVAALAVGRAIAHRQIGWPDEPVGLLVTEWAGDPRGEITLRQLMQMSSGLAPGGAVDDPAHLNASALRHPLAARPGLSRLDQPADPQLLALALERATHDRYANIISGSLWRRIGAADAWLWLDRAGGAAHADCCMIARQGDWIRVGQLLVRDGNYRGEEVVRPGWVALMRQPAKSDPRYGSFLRLDMRPSPQSEVYGARDVFVAGGRDGNRMWLVPSMGLVILRTGAPTGEFPQWDEVRIPNLIMRGARDYLPPAALPGSDLSSLVPAH